MRQLIDISKHNGKIDFGKVEKAVDGIIIRAGYGWEFHKDPMLDTYRKECQRYAIPYGLYCYSYATSLEQAKKEVQGFLACIKGMRPEYPVIIDTEDADKWRLKNGNPSWGEKASMLLYQLREIERAGYYAMYYCSTSWYDQMVRREPDLKKYDLWLAHWGIKEPSRPCGVWQYTSGGTVPGIRGRVDMNTAYKDYPAIIREKGLNGFEAGAGKSPKKPPAGRLLITYLYDGDLPNAVALFNLYAHRASLIKGEPMEKDGATVIQLGGPRQGWADLYLAGKDRRETFLAVADFLESGKE